MTGFLLSLAAVAGVLALATAAGFAASPALFSRSQGRLAERIGWSFGIGCALIAGAVPIAFITGLPPGWIPLVILAALAVVGGRFLPLPPPSRFALRRTSPGEGGGLPAEALAKAGEGEARATAPVSWPTWVLVALLLSGVALYALRALTEPMWSNDFLAIWGFKGKTIFFSRGLPSRLYDWKPLAFSHPEYPLGLPFLYAGVSFLTGRWDDHAMALLFPFFQVATLCVLFGWLRRRGASRETALCAAALVALFEPLYSAFLTGMAEVPLAFGLLLFGTALVDATDPPSPDGLRRASSGALRCLAFAAAFLAATKNEGLYLAAAGFAIVFLSGGSRRLRTALAALVPALAVYGLHIAWRGRAALSDFDFALFSAARLAEALGSAARVPSLAGWLGFAALGALIAFGSHSPSGNRLLLLAACGLAAYLILPAFAVRGPTWLVQATLLRTASALAPLVAAAVAVRLGDRSATAT